MKDYPQLSIRLPSETKAKLQALSVISARPQWRLITDAIDCYLHAHTEAEQQLVQELVSRSRAATLRARRRGA